MSVSVGIGVLMLFGKTAAYFLTGSAAILSDAAESVVHLFAVLFAGFSVWLVAQPANDRYNYGYERVSFFSAAFEGAMIVLAALLIVQTAIQKWLAGLTIENLGWGTAIVAAAAAINALLGWWLLRLGKLHRSLILEANGKHILTDSWTSAGVIVGLGLVLVTGWKPFDPIFAIVVALNILWSGSRLVLRSVSGLMDKVDPGVAATVAQRLEQASREIGVEYHAWRVRGTGRRWVIEVHLLFPYHLPVGEAHRLATRLEMRLPELLDQTVEVVTHLEALEDHETVHGQHHQVHRGLPAGKENHSS